MAFAAQDVQPPKCVDYSQIERTIAELPASVIERHETDRLADEDLADIERVALPFDLAVVAHSADLGIVGVFRLPKPSAIAARRWRIVMCRRGLAEGFVRALFIVGLAEAVEPALLGRSGCSGWTGGLALQGQMEAFVPSVLLRLTGLDPLRNDACLD